MLFNETLGALLFCPIDLTLAVSGRVIIDTVKVYSFGRVKLKKHCTMIRPKQTPNFDQISQDVRD